MVYQQFINYPNLSVFENIASPLKVTRAPAGEVRERALEGVLAMRRDETARLERRCADRDPRRVAVESRGDLRWDGFALGHDDRTGATQRREGLAQRPRGKHRTVAESGPGVDQHEIEATPERAVLEAIVEHDDVRSPLPDRMSGCRDPVDAAHHRPGKSIREQDRLVAHLRNRTLARERGPRRGRGAQDAAAEVAAVSSGDDGGGESEVPKAIA